MGKRLYVGNLSYSVKDENLRELFAQVGQVTSAVVITDRESGRSKGFGFVEMDTDDLAQQALSKFNGFVMMGRPLSVSEARPPAPREGGGRGDRGGDRWRS
ncbi:MAG: RNA-binding protein [Anaerolineales bacterium]|nr:RNA-binding protein [Anaerolineales bacterium]